MHAEFTDATQRGAIAVFVKTPEYSPVKTRLAHEVGTEAAQQFYALACAATASVLLQAQRALKVQIYWAVAEPHALRHPRWSQFDACTQGAGELGERMQCVFDALLKKHRYVLLLGADSPQICLHDLRQADAVLRSNSPQYLLAPAADGGFWCVAGNQPIASQVWKETRYSCASTLEDFEALLSVHQLPAATKLRGLTDVDTLADWLTARMELQCLTAPTIEQAALLSLNLEPSK
jgi:uncharacterized protein